MTKGAVVSSAVALAVAAAIVPASAPATSIPSCATRPLVVWVDTNGNGAAGSAYFGLEFTNLSGRTCTLLGYPGVSAVDLAGRRLGMPAVRSAQTPARRVTVPPGRTVTAVLQIADISVFSRSSCRPITAAGLRVYPPNQRQSKVVPFPFRACSRTGPAYLHVDAVARS